MSFCYSYAVVQGGDAYTCIEGGTLFALALKVHILVPLHADSMYGTAGNAVLRVFRTLSVGE